MRTLAILRVAGLGMLLAGVTAANAQTLRDPTRPPGAVQAKTITDAEPTNLVLQSILISPERKAAVISGKVVGPGESVGGYMLMAIAEGEAILKNGSQIRRLRLYPSVDMSRQKDVPGRTDNKAPTASGDRQ